MAELQSTSNFPPIPGDKGLPLVGHTLAYLHDVLALSNKMERRYGKVFSQRVLGKTRIRLLGADACQLVLQNRDNTFSSARGWSQILEALFPNGLMLMDGSEHRWNRRLMQAAFKQRALQGYFDTIQQVMTGELQQRGDQVSIAVHGFAKAATLRVACQVFLGNQLPEERDALNSAFRACVAASASPLRLSWSWTTYGRGLRARKQLEAIFSRQISRCRHNPGNELLSQLCQARDEDGLAYSDRQVLDHIIFLMMAAHDTTASALTSLLHALVEHPQWQDRLRDEFISHAPLTYERLGQLELTGWVLKEALRLYPPLVNIPRVAVKSFDFNGYHIPAGTFVGISPAHTHRDPVYWSEPERFDPERFSPGRAEDKRHPYQWVPFGGGVHKCIGLQFAEMEIKVFLYHLLTRYGLGSAGLKPVRYQQVPIWKPRKDIPLRLEPL